MNDTAKDDRRWYCLRTGKKREHIAGQWLRQRNRLDVFMPRLRVRRPTVRGPVWFEEAMFPGYLIARFDLAEEMRSVLAAPGIVSIVHFGPNIPHIDDSFISDLRAGFHGDDGVLTVPLPSFQSNDIVTIVKGPFAGMRGLVSAYFPAKERIRVLLDILGSQAESEISVFDIEHSGFGPACSAVYAAACV